MTTKRFFLAFAILNLFWFLVCLGLFMTSHAWILLWVALLNAVVGFWMLACWRES